MSDAAAILPVTADAADLDPVVHGAKAVGLQRLMRLGVAVPPAVVVSIDRARAIAAGDPAPDLTDALAAHLPAGPLAVRSGAAVSLPGGMDTVLEVDPADVVAAISRVVASARAPRADAAAAAIGAPRPETAVVVQQQIDATADERSGAGAATSRDPVTGDAVPSGSFLWQRLGEQVMGGETRALPLAALVDRTPDVLAALVDDLARIDEAVGSAVEVEFAIERGALWYLQLRPFTIEPYRPAVIGDGADVLATGTAASGGVGTGRLHVDIDDALDATDRGEPVILVRPTTSPADVTAMVRSAAVVTALGGRESHAAVIARSVGIPAVVAVRALEIGADHIRVGEARVEVGEELVVDGTAGTVARPANRDPATVRP